GSGNGGRQISLAAAVQSTEAGNGHWCPVTETEAGNRHRWPRYGTRRPADQFSGRRPTIRSVFRKPGQPAVSATRHKHAKTLHRHRKTAIPHSPTGAERRFSINGSINNQSTIIHRIASIFLSFCNRSC